MPRNTDNDRNRKHWVLLNDYSHKLSFSGSEEGTQSIDVVSDGVVDKIHLAAPAGFSGRTWSITSLGNSYCRLTNNFTGSEIALDILNDDNDNLPRLTALGGLTGQQWRIVNGDGSICHDLADVAV